MDHSHTPRPRLVVGTAGHIDHGKSSLVLALTGVDPDRLPEEKARGMTIDLGFAYARIEDADIWFVDVPGHERFLRNMVAGATGIDLPLLVVAADDSAMPQTREHVEVLSLLGFSRCLVALTKIDLVDADWCDVVEQDVRELVERHALEVAGVVRTSAPTGRGLDELRARLASEARRPPAQSPYDWFRVPIDRAFLVPGRGVVVTGSTRHGSVSTGDELELCPPGRRVRVRDLQSHNLAMPEAHGRMRLAMNLASVAVDDAPRGSELASPGHLQESDTLCVRVASLRMPGRAARRRLRPRLHIGTCDVLAQVSLLEPSAPAEVRAALAQVRTQRPIVSTWGQTFILRDESATRTLGGGVVLAPVAERWSRRSPADAAALVALESDDPHERLAAAVRMAHWNAPDAARLSSRAGIRSAAEVERLLDELSRAGRIVRLAAVGGQQRSVHRERLDALSAFVLARLGALLAANPRSAGVPRAELPALLPAALPEALRQPVVEWMLSQRVLVESGGFLLPRGHAGALSTADAALLETICAAFAAARFQPPSAEELAARTGRDARRVGELISLAAARGRLVRIAPGVWLDASAYGWMLAAIHGLLAERGSAAVADFRGLLESTRKYVVPILEHLDAEAFTRRRGDARVRGPKAAAMLEKWTATRAAPASSDGAETPQAPGGV